MIATSEPTTEVTLPSGAKLVIQLAPFAEAKALYQALLADLKEVEFSAATDFSALFKNIICAGFSSPRIEQCLYKCLARCLIDGVKISNDTFEPAERRGDYLTVCVEVMKANIAPFMKSLYAVFQQFLAMVNDTRE